MGDSTWLSTVQTYNFAKNGLSELQNPKVVSTLTNAYAEVQWRQGLDQATPGLANALTFLSQASSIKSINDVFANETNFQVITTALGIPENIVFQNLTAQKSAINSRLDYAKFQDPQLRHQPDRPVPAHHAGKQPVQLFQQRHELDLARRAGRRPGGLTPAGACAHGCRQVRWRDRASPCRAHAVRRSSVVLTRHGEPRADKRRCLQFTVRPHLRSSRTCLPGRI